jgi:hypothetical protein
MGWIDQVRAKQAARAAAREAAVPTLTGEFYERPPGWTDLGQTFTTVFPAGKAPDPLVVAAIQRFCPDYVPIWMNWEFGLPFDTSGVGKTEVFGRHVLARLVTDPAIATHEFPGLAYGVANYMERIIMGPTVTRPGETDLPGDYRPVDWTLYEELRRVYHDYHNVSPKEYARKAVMSPLEVKVRLAAYRAAERMGLQSEVSAWMQKLFDAMSEVDLKNFMLYGKPKKDPKVAVVVGAPPSFPTSPTSLT